MSGGGGDGPGCPLWIISFADMISNLVIFFILMATFGAHESGKPTPARVRDEGVFKHDGAPLPNVIAAKAKEGAVRGAYGPESPSARREKILAERYDRFVQTADYDVRPDITRLPDGLKIRLLIDDLFKSGSDRLNEDAEQIVSEIGNFFRGEACEFVVEAHVDARTYRYTHFADDVAYSRRLAARTAKVLAETCGIDNVRIAVSSRGAAEPVDSNETAIGRSRNRRIEVIVRTMK